MTKPNDPLWYPALAPYIERDDLVVGLTQPVITPDGRSISSIQSCFLRVPRWTGSPFTHDLGKKSAGMVELSGEHLFAELAILRLLERDRWHGRWVSTYGGRGEVSKYLTEWHDVPYREQQNRPIEDDGPRQLLEAIADQSPARYAGCWDVFAWRGGQYLFMDTKRQTRLYKDRVQETQVAWLQSALALALPGLTEDSFTFVQWDYIS